MATAIKCDAPMCAVATDDLTLAGWTRITVNSRPELDDGKPLLPSGDYDFHDPACIHDWIDANTKGGS